MQGRISDGEGTTAVVTGASGGIGYSVSLALARAGYHVLLVARRAALLEDLATSIRATGGRATVCAVDLLAEPAFDVIAAATAGRPVGALVHSAAAFTRSSFADADDRDFDRLFTLNVRVPIRLTQVLLPGLVAARGHIVFMNSSAGMRTNKGMMLYAASKHALRAVADTLRLETNPQGVRVLSVYCGRVATPMQEAIFAQECRPYTPELLTQPDDIADALVNALAMPRTTEMTDLHVRPAVASY